VRAEEEKDHEGINESDNSQEPKLLCQCDTLVEKDKEILPGVEHDGDENIAAHVDDSYELCAVS
jgi:hypothetical protein